MNKEWRDGEARYCQELVLRGSRGAGCAPTVREYLLIQATLAHREKEFEISALLAIAASYLEGDEPGEENWLAAQITLAQFADPHAKWQTGIPKR